jgi:hypothetical protein
LEKNLDKLNWERLSRNPNIFEYDYAAIKNRMYKKDKGIKEDLMKNRFHPMNMTMNKNKNKQQNGSSFPFFILYYYYKFVFLFIFADKSIKTHFVCELNCSYGV